jgi:hypothetical protein
MVTYISKEKIFDLEKNVQNDQKNKLKLELEMQSEVEKNHLRIRHIFKISSKLWLS